MKHFLYFLLVVFFIGCTSNTIYDQPKDLIPKDTMELLLVDMYIASASKNIKDKLSKKRKTYLPLIYEKYKIDSTRFYLSNNYYTSKIEDYTDLLDGVRKKIEAKNTIFQAEFHLKDSLKKKEQKEKRTARKKKDSIRKAQHRKDYIPLILQKSKIDSTKFYNISDLFTPNFKEYNHIVNIKDLTEEEDITSKKKKEKKVKKSKKKN